jgi:hypothetical protein
VTDVPTDSNAVAACTLIAAYATDRIDSRSPAPPTASIGVDGVADRTPIGSVA